MSLGVRSTLWPQALLPEVKPPEREGEPTASARTLRPLAYCKAGANIGLLGGSYARARRRTKWL